MDDLVVVKLGGSVITHKNRSPPATDQQSLLRIAQELRSHHGPLVVIHGGGAYGHQAAAQYGYQTPGSSPDQKMKGVPEIRRNMSKLAFDVQSALFEADLKPVVFPPFTWISLDGGEIVSYYHEPLERSLRANLTVITHGDVCFDRKSGATILSGDTLAAWMALRFGAERVLVGTNVDGVFHDDPHKNPYAELMPVIDSHDASAALGKVGPSRDTDVTGGMAKKLTDLLTAAREGVEVIIFNLTVPGRLRNLLKGRSELCTRIL